MALEVSHLIYRSTGVRDALGLILAVLLAIAFAAAGLPSAGLAVAAGIMAFALAGRLWRQRSAGQALIAYPYLVLPFVALIWLRNDPSYGLEAVFWLLVMVWAIDSFAYFAGRTIGGPKLMPSISPKKTWAGLIGGMVGAVAAGVAAALMIGAGSPILLAVVSAGLAIVEQLGDFFESAMKRRAGLKDSGHLIPGHGGVLDRVDGLMAVTVAAALLGIVHNAANPAAGVLIWP
jgi:phosphatidate cytidylyltransferase